MSGFLVDTNILSRLAPERMIPDTKLVEWIATEGDAGTLYISAVTLAELERGCRKLKRAGNARKAETISTWIDTIQNQYAERILPVDGDVGRVAGMLDEFATSIGKNPGLADILIAATALAHGLALVTANGKHFDPLPIKWINPADL